MSKQITQTLRCKLVKPVDRTWDELGMTLRALSWPLHRVLNGVITELELAARAEETHRAEPIHPRTRSYRLTRDLWRAERQAAADRVASGKPYAGDEAIATTGPASSVVLGMTGLVFARWDKFRKERWRGKMSLPTFKVGPPICVASSSKAVTIEASDGTAVLTLRLVEKEKPVRLVVVPYGPAGFSALRSILRGSAKLGEAKIKHDGSGWQVFLSYTHDAPSRASGRTMALHRGVHCFLSAAISGDGAREAYTPGPLETGDDILQHKRGYNARRRSLGQQGRQLGAGAKGHGRSRRYERIENLESAEANWVRSKCQEVAAHAMRLADQRGVSRILLEDWGNPATNADSGIVETLVRQFPLAQLKETIHWAAKKRGIEVVEAPGSYQNRDCPACGHRHQEPPLRRDRSGRLSIFLCSECRLERPVDVIAAWNLLVRDGKPSPLADAKKAGKRAAGRLRAARNAG